MLEHSPFDACTNTGAETTVSKCFDAISQQSVKQKTFVAFYTVHGKKTVSTQKDAEISQQEPSLFVDATPSPACLSQAERESNTHISSVKDRLRRRCSFWGYFHSFSHFHENNSGTSGPTSVSKHTKLRTIEEEKWGM